MSRADGVLRDGFGERLDEHRRVEGWIPDEGGVHFYFWNGAVRSSIRLSDEAFLAAVRIYAALQKKQVELEAHSAQGKHPAIGCSEKEKNVNFGQAIEALKAGKKMARSGWNGKGIFIELQTPDDNSKMTSPYIFIDTTGLQTDNSHAPKSRVPWLASQTDMLAEDWQIIE